MKFLPGQPMPTGEHIQFDSSISRHPEQQPPHDQPPSTVPAIWQALYRWLKRKRKIFLFTNYFLWSVEISYQQSSILHLWTNDHPVWHRYCEIWKTANTKKNHIKNPKSIKQKGNKKITFSDSVPLSQSASNKNKIPIIKLSWKWN